MPDPVNTPSPQGNNVQPVATQQVGVGDTFADISKALKTLRDPKMWLRIGMFLTGAFLTWLAIWQLTGDNQMGNVRKTIIKVGGALVTKKVK